MHASSALPLRLALVALGFIAAPLRAQFEYVSSGGTFRIDAVNLARAAGATAIGMDEYGTPHFISRINDGAYGNSFSWLGYADFSTYNSLEESYSWVGVQWESPITIASFALGRDNLGVFTDRAGGPYVIQVDQGGGWTEVGTLIYGTNISVASNSVRNLFNLSSPLTGVRSLRILTPRDSFLFLGIDPETESDITTPITGQAIDELEVYATPSAIPEPSAFAALAGFGSLGLALMRRRGRS